jgi:hypothetical protein
MTSFINQAPWRKPVMVTGVGHLLIASALTAAGGFTHHFYGALVLLGFGWNARFISADQSALANAVSAARRQPVIQGVNDTLIALASTACVFLPPVP